MLRILPLAFLRSPCGKEHARGANRCADARFCSNSSAPRQLGFSHERACGGTMAGGPLGLGVLPRLKRIVRGKPTKRRHGKKRRHAKKSRR